MVHEPNPQTEHEQEACWRQFVRGLRQTPEHPFPEHLEAFREAFAERSPAAGPPPIWSPEPAQVAASNLGRFMAERGFSGYRELYEWSVRERASFWGAALERLGIVLRRPPERILDLREGAEHPRWLVGAELSIVESCFTAPAERPAIRSGREGSDEVRVTTYGELEALAARVARGLAHHGLDHGGVALYMPMNVECVAAYLGILRAGAYAVSIADSFPPPEVERRLALGGARAVVTVESFRRAGHRFDLYRKVREAGAQRVIVLPEHPGRRPEGLAAGDLAWEDLLDGAPELDPGPAVGDPYRVTNVLFSSGTTGEPKAIPWTHLTPLKCAMDGHFHQDIQPADTVAWPTNIGWMMGPWLIYATLINGATMALFEGAPTGREFAGFIERAGVTVLGVVPSLVSAWRRGRIVGEGGADWSRVRVLSSTGEPSGREDYLWLMSRTGYHAPVIEYCGGTEIGGGYLTGSVVQPASPAAFTTPALGLDFVLLDEAGRPVDEGEGGEVFLIPPSIGLSQELWNRDHHEVYYEGCPPGPAGETLRRHGDRIERLAGGFYRAQGRVDDTMNLGGIKVSSVEIERVLDLHPAVSESAAIAVRSESQGRDRLIVFAILSAAASGQAPGLRRDLERHLASRLNPLFKIEDLVLVDQLPRTASNKLMRRELRARYAGSAS